MHPGPAHLLERDLLADDHLGHPRAAEVHRRVALDHDDDVAEAGDVGPTRGRRPEQAADLRHLARQRDLVVEDPPRPATAREHLDLVGDAGAGAVDQPEDRKLLAQCGLRGTHDLLDGARPPRAGLDRGVVGDDHDRSTVDGPPPGDHAVGRQARRPRVRVAAVLDEAAGVDQQGDPVAHVELVLARELGRRLLGRALGCRVRGFQPRPHVRDPRVPDDRHRHLGGQRVGRRPVGRGHGRRGVAGRLAARRGGGLFEVRAHRHAFRSVRVGCSGGRRGSHVSTRLEDVTRWGGRGPWR